VKRKIIRTAAGFTSLLITAFAGASPIVIDTQEEAAAAALTTHSLFLGENVPTALPVLLGRLAHPSRLLVLRTLEILSAATTPDDLTALKGGLTVACPLGGSVKARLPRDGSLTLHLEWSGCSYLKFPTVPNTTMAYTGPAAVQLLENTFAPSTVALIRLGSATEDVVAREHGADEYSSYTSTQTMNIRMAGSIPMTRPHPSAWFSGDFDYRITGLYRNYDGEPVTPPETPSAAETITIQNAWVSGSQTGFGLFEDADLFITRGTFTYESNFPPAAEPSSYSVTAHDLHWFSMTDTESPTLDRAKTLDGRADITWSANHGSGCLNGTYVFRTDKLLEQSLYTGGVILAGELKINNALTLRYASPYSRPITSPPPVFQGTITLDLKRVGVTSIPYDWQAFNVLAPRVECTP